MACRGEQEAPRVVRVGMWAGLGSRKWDRERGLVSMGPDGALSELEDALVRNHLGRCADCNSFAVGIEGFTGVLRAAPAEQPSRPVSLPRRSRSVFRSVQFGAAAAAVAAVVGLGSVL